MNAVDQFLSRKSRYPRFVCATARPELGDNHKPVRIRMERLLNNSIGHMRAVVVAGVNLVHAGLYCMAQNGDGAVNVAWRSPHARSCKLHCTVAHAIHCHRGGRQGEGAGEISLCNHFISPWLVYRPQFSVATM